MKKLLLALLVCFSMQITKSAPTYTHPPRLYVAGLSAGVLAWSCYTTWQLTKKMNAIRTSYEKQQPDFENLTKEQQNEYLQKVMPLSGERNTHYWAIQPLAGSIFLMTAASLLNFIFNK